MSDRDALLVGSWNIKWSSSDDDKLIEAWTTKPVPEIAADLDRTQSGIVARAERLGLLSTVYGDRGQQV